MQIEKLEIYKVLVTSEEVAHLRVALETLGALPAETLRDLLKIESADGQEAFKVLNGAILEKLKVQG